MIIKDKAENNPVLSNVGEIGEFRIRNSAKAFGILSSGLYANKVRAIIREYSCNAVDSHVEAGRADTPFDVHLPNSLEPWFSVRDYGVGLDEDQVTNIFTTYFESTKTGTDELIGGLGLGSKSAFSYTDNFTVTAIKHGIKRVFTAFINEQGVPSIAKMAEQETDEPTGVEIRFAVEDTYDFHKFQSEAASVYKYFKLRPVVSGGRDFRFYEPKYTEMNIIPGVHIGEYTNRPAVAIMGNIEYPIDVPANMNLGNDARLLKCGLVIEFDIGQLDIQASREGLSYIPETVAAIKTKLEAVNAVLASKIAVEAAKVKNVWERVEFLIKKANVELWAGAVQDYVRDLKKPYITPSTSGYSYERISVNGKAISVKDLAERYNITINSPYPHRLSTTREYDRKTGNYSDPVWKFSIVTRNKFVINDTKRGAVQRTLYDIENNRNNWRDTYNIYILNPADKKKEMRLDAFFKAIYNPPKETRRLASTFLEKPRATGMGKNISILVLEKRDNNRRMNSDDMVWRDAGPSHKFDANTTYYYIPLSGFQMMNKVGQHMSNATDFHRLMTNAGLAPNKVYGVRKSDIEEIQKLPNWVMIDDYLIENLQKTDATIVNIAARDRVFFDSFFKFDVEVDETSPYQITKKRFPRDAGDAGDYNSIKRLGKMLGVEVDLDSQIADAVKEIESVMARYPLLTSINAYRIDNKAVANYITAMDLLLAQNEGKD